MAIPVMPCRAMMVALLLGALGARGEPARAAGAPPTPLEAVQSALEAGDGTRALQCLEDSGTSVDSFQGALLAGRAHLLIGNPSQARRLLEDAIRLQPASSEAHYWLGRSHAAGGSCSLAIGQFEKARWHGLDSAELHYHWASALRDVGRLLGEIRQVDLESEAPLPGPGSFCGDGVVIAVLEDGSTSATAIAVGGSSPERHPVDAPRRVVVSPSDSAIYHAYKALALEPQRGPALLLAARIWAGANRHETAAEVFAAAAERLEGPLAAECHRDWAESLLTLGDLEGFIGHARQSIQLAGGSQSGALAECYERAAAAAARRGELQRQIRYLRLAVELKKQVPRLVQLADALIQAQDLANAAYYLKIALEYHPTDRELREIHARLQRTAGAGSR